MNKQKVTGSLSNIRSKDEVLIDANGDIRIGCGVVKTSLQITGFTGSIWSVSGSIERTSTYQPITGNISVGDPVVLLDTRAFQDLIINISNHTGNDYTLYSKQINNSRIDTQVTGADNFYVDNIFFTLTASHIHTEGSVHWSDDDKTLEVDTEVAGVSLQVGQEMFVRATNKTGATILNGQSVYISGAQGKRPTVYLAHNQSEFISDHTLGLATHDIANNATGYINVFGLVRDVDTSAFGNGDIVYVGDTSGSVTNIEPVSPKHAIRIGYNIYSHATEGIIFVHVEGGPELKDIHDVLAPNPTSNDVIQYNASTGLWENKKPILTGFSASYQEITSDYKLTENDYFIEAKPLNNDVEIMLPTAAGKLGKEYAIKRTVSGSFNLVIAATGSEKIDGFSSHTINDQYISMTVFSNGSKWLIV